MTGRKTVQKGGFGPKCSFFSLKIGWRQRVKTKLASKNKNKRFAITKINKIIIANTVLRTMKLVGSVANVKSRFFVQFK